MIRLFDCGRPVTTHIDKKKSKCDYRLYRPLTEAEIEEIERRVNAVIRVDSRVRVEFIDRAEAEKHYDLEHLPDDVRERIRIVRIGDYDACPCVGTHVTSTNEIGRFSIASVSYQDGLVRIRYKLADPRVGGVL